MTADTPRGTLYLVPAPLDFGCEPQAPLTDVLPEATLQHAARLTHWVCENAKSCRAYPSASTRTPRWPRRCSGSRSPSCRTPCTRRATTRGILTRARSSRPCCKAMTWGS